MREQPIFFSLRPSAQHLTSIPNPTLENKDSTVHPGPEKRVRTKGWEPPPPPPPPPPPRRGGNRRQRQLGSDPPLRRPTNIQGRTTPLPLPPRSAQCEERGEVPLWRKEEGRRGEGGLSHLTPYFGQQQLSEPPLTFLGGWGAPWDEPSLCLRAYECLLLLLADR